MRTLRKYEILEWAEKGLSARLIADKLKCTAPTVVKYAKIYGIYYDKIRGNWLKKSKIDISQHSFFFYVSKGWTSRELAEHYGCHRQTIRNRALEWGVLSKLTHNKGSSKQAATVKEVLNVT